MTNENISKENVRELLRLGRDNGAGKSLTGICDEAETFFDKKCADEFNSNPDTKYPAAKIHTWFSILDAFTLIPIIKENQVVVIKISTIV